MLPLNLTPDRQNLVLTCSHNTGVDNDWEIMCCDYPTVAYTGFLWELVVVIVAVTWFDGMGRGSYNE